MGDTNLEPVIHCQRCSGAGPIENTSQLIEEWQCTVETVTQIINSRNTTSQKLPIESALVRNP